MSLAPDVAERPANIVLLQSHSLTTLVQRELERMIVSGEIAGGEKLNEAVLASRLGVSRGPVRETFRALEETGLVRIEKNRGVFVREISVDEADEIYELRATFDQLAGVKLASRITPGQLAELREVLHGMEAATAQRDADRYHALNLLFHDKLVDFAGNAKLLQIYRRLVNELSLYRRQSLAQRDRLPDSTREHQRILDAIGAGDAEATGRMLHEHAMASRARVHALRSGAVAQSFEHPDHSDAGDGVEARAPRRRRAQR